MHIVERNRLPLRTSFLKVSGETSRIYVPEHEYQRDLEGQSGRAPGPDFSAENFCTTNTLSKASPIHLNKYTCATKAYPAKRIFAAALGIGGIENVDIDFGSVKRFSLKALHQYCLGRIEHKAVRPHVCTVRHHV